MAQKGSDLEQQLVFYMKAVKIPTPVRELTFLDGRRFRFDFAWPDQMLAVEVEGGIWSGGAHTRGKHFNSDCEKYNLAALKGWRVLRVTETHIKDGRAIGWIQEALRETPVE